MSQISGARKIYRFSILTKNTDFEGIGEDLEKNAIEADVATAVERENSLEHICANKNERLEIRD